MSRALMKGINTPGQALISANLKIMYKGIYLAYAFSLAFSEQLADPGTGFDELRR